MLIVQMDIVALKFGLPQDAFAADAAKVAAGT